MRSIGAERPVFIFDIGGVVIIWANNDPIFRYIAERYNIPFRRLKSTMNEAIGPLEEGKIDPSRFVEESLAKFGKKLRAGDLPDELITIPFGQGAKSRLGVVKIIQRLRKSGYEVDGFSNTNSAHVNLMKKRGWTTPLFNYFFASCLIGALKPSVFAFRRVLREIGAKPDQVIFVDNLRTNVLGARKAGIRNSIQFHSIKDLEMDLKRVIQRYD